MDSRSHNLPGQVTLEGLESEMGYLSITHLKPQQELFAEEFVFNGGNAKRAYQKAYPGTKDTAARANSCRLLKTGQIQQRISEIRAELQRRYSVDAQAVVRLLTMSMGVDRRLFLKEDGTPADFHDLPAEAAAITDIQIVIDRNGKKQALPVIPERLRSAIELARIIGLTKDKIEISGIENSGPLLSIYLPSNNRGGSRTP